MEEKLVFSQIRELLDSCPYALSNIANISAYIYQVFPDLNWAGFYFIKNGILRLGPFQGRPACVEIDIQRGVCGAAVRTDRVFRVDNVHSFPGHIACDEKSRSELVIPIHVNGIVFGVLDLDSPLYSRFSDEDEKLFTGIVSLLEAFLESNPIPAFF